MRIYNPALAKFLSVDPLTSKYPFLTPYQFASNSPISGVDLDGLEYYYSADGAFLGKIGESQEVYTADKLVQETITNPDGTSTVNTKPINPINLNINHTEFTTIANIVRQEGGTKKEMQWIAFTANNAANESHTTLYKKLMTKFSSVNNKNKVPLSDNDKSKNAKNARAGVISVLRGDSDPTDGATLWDGIDFIAWGLNSPNGTPQNKFEEYKSINIPSSIYQEYSNACSGTDFCTRYSGKEYDTPSEVFRDPKNFNSKGDFDYKTGSKQPKGIKATGTAGGSIFWKKTK
jgi:hypothetical protein